MKLILVTIVCLLLHNIAFIHAACGPPMCNDDSDTLTSSLMAPALAKLIHNHSKGNTTLKNLPCTACLPCCDVLLQLERVSNQHGEVFSHLSSLIDHVDWTCSAKECPTHATMRRVLSKAIEEKTVPVLDALELMKSQTQENVIALSMKEHLIEYAAQISRNGISKKQQPQSMEQFISNVMSCPCTACPQECAFRKLVAFTNPN
ncbi:hypothetical protein C9374_006626 [Naegleria lovaniensis]|uniref:Uncharacterized protein n=1 Tax=Naegleria lovaniensis TaxID=51637 RepID=A0AA88GHH5_NAELO|nr:uncharacterized protein C9374_006626 [Naegleria lovaniensis]KAG2379509.1 hypothetical protein C9374_006626 [Naegleria lovaniensis]